MTSKAAPAPPGLLYVLDHIGNGLCAISRQLSQNLEACWSTGITPQRNWWQDLTTSNPFFARDSETHRYVHRQQRQLAADN